MERVCPQDRTFREKEILFFEILKRSIDARKKNNVHYICAFSVVTDEVTEKFYVSTLLGRRRYLREVHDTNYQVREFARRAAMNAPIQGTAADLIKIAMIKVNKALKENNLESKIICQIHDELLIKVPNNEKEKVYDLVKNIMENAMKLDVKLEVDGGYGRTWYDAK